MTVGDGIPKGTIAFEKGFEPCSHIGASCSISHPHFSSCSHLFLSMASSFLYLPKPFLCAPKVTTSSSNRRLVGWFLKLTEFLSVWMSLNKKLLVEFTCQNQLLSLSKSNGRNSLCW
ncbi:hypothetical protein QN277_009437 [Acacia crassicarpa]|uniref:Uncharacterized protein n=1 Tax=Acacia crassicarpa TaxID=499986 RepID=A0AAE1JM48_9FABA|nr:hypothetical protein QN277_009437 [Acacia crassicarpa]